MVQYPLRLSTKAAAKKEMSAVASILSITLSVGVTFLSFQGHLMRGLRGRDLFQSWPISRIHLRVALAAPLLACFATLAYHEPRTNLFCEACLSAYEGYIIYVFWCLLVLHLGGVEKTINHLAIIAQGGLKWKLLGDSVTLYDFGHGETAARSCYRILCNLILQYALIKSTAVFILFLVVRSCADARCSHDRVLSLQVFVRCTSLLCLICALGALLQGYRWLRAGLEQSMPRGGYGVLYKFMAIKLLVFLITIQKLIIALAFSAFPTDPIAEEQSPAESRSASANRTYLMVLLLEAPLYAALLLTYFGSPTHIIHHEVSPLAKRHSKEIDSRIQRLQMSRAELCLDVLKFHKIMSLDCTDSDMDLFDNEEPKSSVLVEEIEMKHRSIPIDNEGANRPATDLI